MKIYVPCIISLYCNYCKVTTVIKFPDGVDSELIQCPNCRKMVVVSDQQEIAWRGI